MTTARQIIGVALTTHLNRLSPGETLDSDLAASCLTALNDVVDELNCGRTFLFRDIFTVSGAITGTYGTLGTDWVGLSSGIEVLGATVRYSATLDVLMEPMTMGQYQSIGIKSLTTYPAYYAVDGASLIYLYPAAAAHVITLRTKQAVSDFANLDTDYQMPSGYRSYLAALVAERMGPSVVGGIPPSVVKAAALGRRSMTAQNFSPAIISAGDYVSGVARIKRGF